MGERISRIKIFDGKTVAAGGSEDSQLIDLNGYRPAGRFSLEVEVSGSGTGKFEYLLGRSRDATGIVPSGASEIATGVTASSGDKSDGHDYFSFEPVVDVCLGIRATETGSTDDIAVTAYLVIAR